MSDLLYGLNESQRKAVMTTEGPVMVIAGPGTGKTLTIVRRIAYLLSIGVNPETILAVTFTNRAAREMRERMEALTVKDSSGLFIGTFHLLGFRIIQDSLPDSFVILNRDDQLNLIKSLEKDSGIKSRRIAEKISRHKNCFEEMDDTIKGVYEKYQAALTQRSALDFDDLILKPVEIIENGISEKYRHTFRYIMVDEYQDINPAQYKLLTLLANVRTNLCVIGDSDQAIYAFRGADVTNFLNFEKDFKKAKRINISENYRSTGMILESSNCLIKNNLKRIDRELRPIKGKGLPVNVVSVPDEKVEGEFIIHKIEERIGGTSHYQMLYSDMNRDFSGDSYSFSDFAVIFRTNAQARALKEIFSLSGIPYQIVGKMHHLKRDEILDVLKEKFEYSNERLSPDEFLKTVLEESGLIENMRECDYTFIQNLLSQFHGIETSEAIMSFMNELSLMTPADAYDPRADAVSLMTVHMAKGLEFRVVFVTGVEEGLIPYTLNREYNDIEEERRLFYVGMTRAKDELFLCHARNRFLYGQNHAQFPSPFIKEIPESFVYTKFIPDKVSKQKKDKQIGLF